jgi:hypothetical protein
MVETPEEASVGSFDVLDVAASPVESASRMVETPEEASVGSFDVLDVAASGPDPC